MEFIQSYTKQQPVPLSGTERPRPTLLSATSERISCLPRSHMTRWYFPLSYEPYSKVWGTLPLAISKKSNYYMSHPLPFQLLGARVARRCRLGSMSFCPIRTLKELNSNPSYKTQIRFVSMNLLKYIHPSNADISSFLTMLEVLLKSLRII